MRDILTEEELRRIVDGLSRPDGDDFIGVVERLRDINPHELSALLRTLMDDPDAPLALGVARAIGILGCREAIDVAITLVEEPGKWFGHSDRSAICMAAIESLGKLGDPAAVEPLLGLIDSAGSAEMQLQAVRALGEIGSPSSVIPLIARMRIKPHIALSAAGAIAQVGGEDAFGGLVAGLSDDEEMVRSACVWALGNVGDVRAVGPLMRLAMYSDALLRRDIAWALGQIGGFPARAALGELCTKDQDIGVRREASRAIRSGAVLKRHPIGDP